MAASALNIEFRFTPKGRYGRISAASELGVFLRELTTAQLREVNKATRLAGLDALARWRRNIPRQTGAYARNTHLQTPTAGTLQQARLFTTTRYASHVEFGTRPHVIVPRRRKALRFTVGGEVVFARRVSHPGTRGQMPLTRAVVDTGPKYRERLTRALNLEEL